MWSVIKSRVVKSNEAIRVASAKAQSFASVGPAISSAHARKSLMEVDIRVRSCRRSDTLTRTFSIADTLDAITSSSPYGKAQSLDAAREKIKHCSEPSSIRRSLVSSSVCRNDT